MDQVHVSTALFPGHYLSTKPKTLNVCTRLFPPVQLLLYNPESVGVHGLLCPKALHPMSCTMNLQPSFITLCAIQLLVYNPEAVVFGFVRALFEWSDSGMITGTLSLVVSRASLPVSKANCQFPVQGLYPRGFTLQHVRYGLYHK